MIIAVIIIRISSSANELFVIERIALISEPRRSDAVPLQLVRQTVQAQAQPGSSSEAAHRGQAISVLAL